jgi:hypothetical protein
MNFWKKEEGYSLILYAEAMHIERFSHALAS